MDVKLLNPKQIAEILGVPVSWIYDRTRASNPNRIPHYKVGKYVRFSEEEVLDYVKTKAAGDGPE